MTNVKVKPKPITTREEFDAHVAKYAQTNPEKYEQKLEAGDFDKQKELMFGKSDAEALKSAAKAAARAEREKQAKIDEAKAVLASLAPEVKEEPKEEKPKAEKKAK